MKDCKDQYLKGKRISPTPIVDELSVKDLIDNHFNGYNAARIQELCHLISEKMSSQDVYVGFSLSGALTPAGLGSSCIVPMIRSGMIDYIVTTGANLYHDLHHSLDLPLTQGRLLSMIMNCSKMILSVFTTFLWNMKCWLQLTIG